MALDRSKFLKIMRLSTSDADGEALSALRKANSMLKAAGMDWASIIEEQTKSDFGQRYSYAAKGGGGYGSGAQYTRGQSTQTAADKAREAAENLRRAAQASKEDYSGETYSDEHWSGWDVSQEELKRRREESRKATENAKKEARDREEREFNAKMREADPSLRFKNLVSTPLFQQMVREKQDSFVISVLSQYGKSGTITQKQLDVVFAIFENWKRNKR